MELKTARCNHSSRDNQSENRKLKGYLFVKRAADLLLGVLGLIVLFLPMVITALVVWIDSPGASPLFVQKRVGFQGKPFFMYKLRSMVPHAEKLQAQMLSYNEMTGPAFKMKEDPRITRVGRFLRKSYIDELPQLWNVVRGEMSLVGPRPPLPAEVEKYTPLEMQRLSIKPGMTCYWQTQEKRYECTFEEWMELDLRYMKERSIKTDCMILLKTIVSVLKMQGI